VRERYALGLATGFVALLLAAPSHAQNVEESWYESTLGATRVGYIHETVRAEADGTVTTEVAAELLVRRADDLVRMEAQERWSETAAGVPVAYHGRRQLSEEATELDATVRGDALVVKRTVRGGPVFSVIESGASVLFPRAVTALHVARGFAPGDTYGFAYFDTDFERVGRSEVTIVGPESLAILGEQRTLTRLVVRSDLYDGIDTIEWRDADGRLWRSEMPVAGIVQERTTREAALGQGATLDILAWTTLPSDVKIDAPRGVDRALYEVWVDGDDVSRLIPEDARQAFAGRTDRGALLEVRRVVPEPGSTVKAPITLPDMRPYLEGNALLQTWYPILIAAAAKCVRTSDGDTWRGATQIEQFVNGHIENKGFGTAFGSATEVLSSRAGDCSEHAVLMAAMTRAVGIPSKLVSGLVYHEGGFAYHMWVEVWTGGGWYALDPTIGDGSVDATHIKLAESAAENAIVADLSVGVLRTWRRLNIHVVSHASGG
jgi:transglutaminase-like putative cysteine protease